jgi:hypothetical protein
MLQSRRVVNCRGNTFSSLFQNNHGNNTQSPSF